MGVEVRGGSAAENEIVNTLGKLQPTVNAVSEAKLNALRNIAKQFNATVYNAQKNLRGL